MVGAGAVFDSSITLSTQPKKCHPFLPMWLFLSCSELKSFLGLRRDWHSLLSNDTFSSHLTMRSVNSMIHSFETKWMPSYEESPFIL